MFLILRSYKINYINRNHHLQRHTISEWTGPDDAFRGERFIFAEMSLPRVPGDKAILQTTVALPGTLTSVDFFSLTE